MVGNLTSTTAMFDADGYTGLESHFGVGGVWGGDAGHQLDGVVYQYQDTEWTADANYQGNPRVISIETADNAPQTVEAIVGWTAAQAEAIARIIAWACTTHNIPPVLVPDSKPGRRGIAYHRQGCEHSDGLGSHPGWLVAGGERWSTVLGKGCPGPTRVTQLSAVVIPRVVELMNGDDMELSDQITLTAAAAAAIGGTYKAGDKVSLYYVLQWSPLVRRSAREAAQRDAAMAARLDSLTKAVTALAANSPAAIQQAFAQGLADFNAALAKIDVTITTDNDSTP
jgi:hypothetical protein